MKYLAFDTSGTYLTVGAKGGEKASVEIAECSHSHSVVLMGEIENCMQKAKLDLGEVEVFACSIGPGSFTGIRIGVATAKAFAYALSKRVLGVTSFESLAYNIVEKVKKLTIVDARHDNFYVCGFDEQNEVILPPCFKSKAEILEIGKGYLIVSDCAVEGVESVVADVHKGFISAVEARLLNATFDRERLVPLYVKKSQAEEEA